MRHAILTFSFFAGTLLAYPLLAEPPQADKDTKKTLKPGGTYLGKIQEIDVTKRTLVLQNVKAVTQRSTLGERILYVSFAPEAGTPPESAASQDPPAEKVQEKTASGVYAFILAPVVEITLDGKSTVFKSLKVGQFARVHVSKNSLALTGTDKDTPGKKNRCEVDRIDAFTKEPAEATRGKG